MPGQVQHLEPPVTEIDAVALVERRRLGADDGIAIGIEAALGERVDQMGRVDPVARGCESFEQLVSESVRAETLELAVLRHRVALEAVDASIVELMEAPDVVVVHVRGDRDQRTLDEVGDLRTQRRDAEPGIDEEVALPPGHVPDVAAQQRMDVRLGEPRDPVVQTLSDEPSIRDRERLAHLPLPRLSSSRHDTTDRAAARRRGIVQGMAHGSQPR